MNLLLDLLMALLRSMVHLDTATAGSLPGIHLTSILIAKQRVACSARLDTSGMAGRKRPVLMCLACSKALANRNRKIGYRERDHFPTLSLLSRRID